jgi:predicted enzyme related to lactoylglutathione lyase
MFRDADTFNSFSTNDLDESQKFYGETLELEVTKDEPMGFLTLRLANGGTTVIYPKDDHVPATFTILNFVVKDIDEAVDWLNGRGVQFEQYGGEMATDEKGVMRGDGPTIAWFKDPAGNVLSIVENGF